MSSPAFSTQMCKWSTLIPGSSENEKTWHIAAGKAFDRNVSQEQTVPKDLWAYLSVGGQSLLQVEDPKREAYYFSLVKLGWVVQSPIKLAQG